MIPQSPYDNSERRSITELELRHAVKTGKPCLLFLLDQNAPWLRSLVETGEGAGRIEALRAELSREYTVNFLLARKTVGMPQEARGSI